MNKSIQTITFTITGQPVAAQFNETKNKTIWYPLLDHWKQLFTAKQHRIIIYLAAPPGAGKSTLAAYLEYLSKTIPDYPKFQVLPMDGFHHTNAYLNAHTTIKDGQTIALKSIKGAPETFDVTNLSTHIRSLSDDHPLKWPIYDRTLHDPIDDAILIDGQILLIEGNYLLLDTSAWSDLYPYTDDTLFIQADPEQLKSRLINRKAKSMHYRQAVRFYQDSDRINVMTVLQHSRAARITLRLEADNDYTMV